jgi:hypothetical protein
LSGNRRREQDPAYGLLRPKFKIHSQAVAAELQNNTTDGHPAKPSNECCLTGDDLEDQEIWNGAITAVKTEFTTLPELILAKISTSTEIIKNHKKAIFALTEAVGGGKICENCRGECCNKGKYHFTIIDLLVFLVEGKALFTPRFGRERCPYAGDAGCLMEPEYRPFNCITFHCERLEELLGASDIEEFYQLEKKLRFQYSELENMFDNRFPCGLLSNYERNFTKNGIILFKNVPGGLCENSV